MSVSFKTKAYKETPRKLAL